MIKAKAIPIALLSLGTSVPPNKLPQEEAKFIARRLFGTRASHFEKMEPVFDNAGIANRYIAKPVDWYFQHHGWKERNDTYLKVSESLYIDAARQALASANVSANEVDCLVTVSTTGIATPSLETRVADRLGFRSDVERVPVFGLGCAGGVSGLAIAARLAAAGLEKTILFVTVELCSISIRLDTLSKANIVATALFGDGAAAAVLRTGGGGIAQIERGAEILWPDSLKIMGWNVEDPGLGVIFDRAIPPFIEEHLGNAMINLLSRMRLSRNEVDRFVCHPGGAKVISALEMALELGPGSLAHERAVLRDYGNMSAPTVLFVLDRLMKEGLTGRSVLLALGPGFTASALSLVAR